MSNSTQKTANTSSGKHTPGPWKVGYGGMTVSTDPGNVGEQLKAGRAVTIRRICDCENPIYIGEKQAQANALLIAAAPELLATLKRVREVLYTAIEVNTRDISNFDASNHAAVKAADAVIAKAEGRAS